MNESLVEVSPSTVIELNDSSATSCRSSCNRPAGTAASVATNPSIVAMFGWIMPEPLAIPVTVTDLPPTSTFLDAPLDTMSVVMMASAALAQFAARRSAFAAGNPATIRSAGNGSMITPVENGNTSSAEHPMAAATASQTCSPRFRPSSPVPAFALPVLTTMARGALPEARCFLQRMTGAAQKRFSVNTPATVAPGAMRMSSTSLRSTLRTPAMAMPSSMPATGNRRSGWAGWRFTGMRLLPLLL